MKNAWWLVLGIVGCAVGEPIDESELEDEIDGVQEAVWGTTYDDTDTGDDPLNGGVVQSWTNATCTAGAAFSARDVCTDSTHLTEVFAWTSLVWGGPTAACADYSSSKSYDCDAYCRTQPFLNGFYKGGVCEADVPAVLASGAPMPVDHCKCTNQLVVETDGNNPFTAGCTFFYNPAESATCGGPMRGMAGDGCVGPDTLIEEVACGPNVCCDAAHNATVRHTCSTDCINAGFTGGSCVPVAAPFCAGAPSGYCACTRGGGECEAPVGGDAREEGCAEEIAD